LAFLVKYAEFHTRWAEREVQDAAWDLVSMFRDELVPKSWWGILLKQAGDLLMQDGEWLPLCTLAPTDLLMDLQ